MRNKVTPRLSDIVPKYSTVMYMLPYCLNTVYICILLVLWNVYSLLGMYIVLEVRLQPLIMVM